MAHRRPRRFRSARSDRQGRKAPMRPAMDSWRFMRGAERGAGVRARSACLPGALTISLRDCARLTIPCSKSRQARRPGSRAPGCSVNGAGIERRGTHGRKPDSRVPRMAKPTSNMCLHALRPGAPPMPKEFFRRPSLQLRNPGVRSSSEAGSCRHKDGTARRCRITSGRLFYIPSTFTASTMPASATCTLRIPSSRSRRSGGVSRSNRKMPECGST